LRLSFALVAFAQEWGMQNFKRSVLVLFICVGSMAVSGCLPFVALRMLAFRGGISRLAATRMAVGVGGEALAATRVAQGNLGAVLAGDAVRRGAVAGSLRLRMIGREGTITGRASISEQGVLVDLGQAQRMVISRPIALRGRPGMTVSSHRIGGVEVSQARYSADGMRIDYYVRNSGSGQLEPAMYGLREANGRSVAFFGINHSYLGRAVYRLPASRITTGGATSPAIIAAIATGSADIDLSQYQPDQADEACSSELINLRRTYYTQGYDTASPARFWTNLYKDCPTTDEVRWGYEQFRVDDIRLEPDRQIKVNKLRLFRREFPNNEDGRLLEDDYEQGLLQ
jgi:hypothetical protein